LHAKPEDVGGKSKANQGANHPGYKNSQMDKSHIANLSFFTPSIQDGALNPMKRTESPALTQKRPLESIFGQEAIWDSKTPNRRWRLSQESPAES
jgi:hypothetical protein